MRYYTTRANPTGVTPPNILDRRGPIATTQCLLDVLYSTRCAERQFGLAPRLASLWNLLPKFSWTEFDYAVFVYKLRLVAGLPSCGPLTRKDVDLLGMLSTSTTGSGAALGHFIRAHFNLRPTFVLGDKNPWSSGDNTDCLGVEATWGLQIDPKQLSIAAASQARSTTFRVRDEQGSARLAAKVLDFANSAPSALSFLTSSADMASKPAVLVEGDVIFQIGSLFDTATTNHASAIANGWMTRATDAPGSAQFAADLGAMWRSFRPAGVSLPGGMTIDAIKWLRGYENLKPAPLGNQANPYKTLIQKYGLYFYGDDQYGVRWQGNASVNKNTPWYSTGAPVYGLSQRMNIYVALRRKESGEGHIASVKVPYRWGKSRPGMKAWNDDKQAWTLNAQVEMNAAKARIDAYMAAFRAREDEIAARRAAELARQQAIQEGNARLIARIQSEGSPLDVSFNKVRTVTPVVLRPTVEPPPTVVLDLINKGVKPGFIGPNLDVVDGANIIGQTDLMPKDVSPQEPSGGGVSPQEPPGGDVLPQEPPGGDVLPQEPPSKKSNVLLLAAVAVGGYLLLKG